MKFSSYSITTQAIPVYLTFIPLVIGFGVFSPEGLKLLFTITSTVIFIPISLFLSRTSADFGKCLELELSTTWGGAPTTRFLRHGNDELCSIRRNTLHNEFRKAGLPVPTYEEQLTAPYISDLLFETCAEDAIINTNNTIQFPHILKIRIKYALHRNLLGIKPLAILISLTTFIYSFIGIYISHTWTANNTYELAALFAITTITAIYWIFFVTERSVKSLSETLAHTIYITYLENI